MMPKNNGNGSVATFDATINLRADRLSNEATDSPIVTKKYIYSGLISLLYTFNY